MKQKKLEVAICLLGMIWSILIVPVASETVEIGPMIITIETESIGSYSVIKDTSSLLDHKKPDFTYEIYSASLTFNDRPNQLLIEVHQMSKSNSLDSPISNKDKITALEHCLERSNLRSPVDDVQNEPYVVDGHKGIFSTVNKDHENPLYIIAFSPDQENDAGSIICIIGSDFPRDITKNIFDSIEIQVV
jgi:hypothetical protein